METAFTAEQYDESYPPGVEHHWWTLARSRFIAGLVRAECAPGAVLLEVGCGKGLVVSALRTEGLEVCGVELAEVPPLAEVRDHVWSGTDAVALPEPVRHRVTGLLLLDVIEHLPDPRAFLAAIQCEFPRLDVVIVTVPACPEIWSNYDVHFGHFQRYTVAQLSELGEKLSWKARDAGYFFHLLYPPARVLAALGIDRQTRFSAPARRWRWLHRLLASINGLGSRLLPRRLKGSSAYAVFQVTDTVCERAR